MTQALALALTVLVETPIATWLAPSRERRMVAVCALLLNLFSHPLAWWARVEGAWPFALVEAAVIAVEAIGYTLVARVSARRALAIAVVANGATIAIAVLL